jgi:hypothetical protein
MIVVTFEQLSVGKEMKWKSKRNRREPVRSAESRVKHCSILALLTSHIWNVEPAAIVRQDARIHMRCTDKEDEDTKLHIVQLTLRLEGGKRENGGW